MVERSINIGFFTSFNVIHVIHTLLPLTEEYDFAYTDEALNLAQIKAKSNLHNLACLLSLELRKIRQNRIAHFVRDTGKKKEQLQKWVSLFSFSKTFDLNVESERMIVDN